MSRAKIIKARGRKLVSIRVPFIIFIGRQPACEEAHSGSEFARLVKKRGEIRFTEVSGFLTL